MQGGAGNDIYVVDDAGDEVLELAKGGIDTVNSAVTFDLSAPAHLEIERLTLTGGACDRCHRQWLGEYPDRQ